MITLTQLEYIVAIDEYRHFATAAEKCFVTQPTLSMQIKKLEDELGVIIFDRSRQPVVPTDLGAKLIEQARMTLSATQRIKEIIQEEQQEVEGTLKIGIIPTLAPYLLPVFIGPYIRKYPAVKVEVEELVSEEIIRRLKRDILDVGLFVTPYHDEKIVERPVFYEEMLVYAHPDSELLKKKEVGHEDIVTSDIWMLGNGHCFRNQVVNLCEMSASQHKNLPFEFESNSLETLMRIVDVEGGFTLIPELALQYMSPEKKKQVRSIANTKPLREVSVIYSRHFTKQRLITLLCDEIKSVVPAHMLKRDRGMIVEWKVEKNE
ncbi:hydrogen peroxide-inducible genes activator [Odoribacter splanchnicus]|jgi:Transcriptional regulator|uniref:LysR substrate-binding domain-containing protein n=1 Tax=Odoribacter splanchnicus TaxID=28118 RepID=A0AAW5CD18_9BACT|nr:hydrogen peroxide-inducible genes activator [Odoribacter splanchnicus]MBV4399550.1 LysR family transcriptional regulator [Odoribacter splanchnicus]MBV4408055.1 LysR family transcriptional regulator [Odoribacter splanchnicus]MCG4962074.1 LysR substrate-binding domain-containing protein [Odoribacter splanchnicus]MCG5005104.1 LysR substrate-binding domain-containing protein [Odoribacter splanchnicus]RHA79931.1 hydrogen peroxide-inducible genes activator [Odoribacter splanchnicus]